MLTAADVLRDEYLAWREERNLEPPFAFTRLVQRFHGQVDEVGGFPYVVMTGPR